MGSSEIVGFIDVGTNSVHLLVVQFADGTEGMDLAQEREVIRLGRSLYGEGRIDTDAIDKCREVISSFASYAALFGAERIYAYATSASRDAENGKDLMDALSDPRVTLKIIPGEEESRLIRMGVLGRESISENKLLIDIGGGSTEFSLCGKDGEYLYASLPLGAVRYAYSFPYDPKKAISDKGYRDYADSVRRTAGPLIERIREMGFSEVIGSSGTFETLAEICSQYSGSAEALCAKDVSRIMKKIRGMDYGERLSMPKLKADRADIMIAGGCIAETVLGMLGADSISISHRGLKEGMKIDYLDSLGYPPVDPRDSSVRSVLIRTRADMKHAETVSGFSARIFDGLRSVGVHSMDDGMRSVLRYASMMHDSGMFLTYGKHQKVSSYLISDNFLTGFVEKELSMMSAMVGRHHKRLPIVSELVCDTVSEAEAKDVLKCIVMLRMADALDRCHCTDDLEMSFGMSGRTAEIGFPSSKPSDMCLWKLLDCGKDFAEAFGYEFRIIGC